MMDMMDYFARQDMDAARAGLTTALSSGESPEQAAIRLQKARTFEVMPDAVPAISPGEEALRKAKAVDWAALHAKAPELVRMMGDPHFAAVIQDDLENQGALEQAVWLLSGSPYKASGVGHALLNGVSRAVYGAFSKEDDLAKDSHALKDIIDKENAIKNGVSDAELFGSETDPTGEMGRRLFDSSKESQKQGLLERIRENAGRTAWATQYSRLFGRTEAGEKFARTETLGDAWRAFKAAPFSVGADLLGESVGAFLPAAVITPFVPTLGARMAVTGIFSQMLDEGGAFRERLGKLGLDLGNKDAITKFFSNTENMGAIDEAQASAREHSIPVAVLDALSYGLAGKTLLPKAITKGWSQGATGLANDVAQAPLQAAMGAGGEALGQIASEGEINSWADVLGEALGEGLMTPLEVASAGFGLTYEAMQKQQVAKKNAQLILEINVVGAKSHAMQRDPEGLAQHFDNVQRRAQVDDLSFDVNDFIDLGLDKRFAGIPEIAKQVAANRETGEPIKVSIATYLTKMAPLDSNGDLTGIVGVGGTPSVKDAEQEAADIQKRFEAAQHEREVAKERSAYKAELAEIGKQMGMEMRRSGERREVSSAVQTLTMALMDALCKDTGFMPSYLWKSYGWTTVGEIQMPPGEVPQGTSQSVAGLFTPAQRVITRLRNANPSTLIHEVAHAFLEMRLSAYEDMMRGLENPEEMPPTRNLTPMQEHILELRRKDFMQNTDALLKWLGFGSASYFLKATTDEKRAAHEKFARTFEAYLYEGEAPTARVRDALRSFRRWMTNTYGAASLIPEAQFSPEAKDMFDRMLASGIMMRANEMRDDAARMFITAEDAGVSPVWWEAYNDQLEEYYADMIERYEGLTRDQAFVFQENIKQLETLIHEGAIQLALEGKLTRKDVDSALEKASKSEDLADMPKATAEEIFGLMREVADELKKLPAVKARILATKGRKVPGKSKPVKPILVWKDVKSATGLSDVILERAQQLGIVTKGAVEVKMGMEDALSALGYPMAPERYIREAIDLGEIKSAVVKRVSAKYFARHPELIGPERAQEAATYAGMSMNKLKLLNMELNFLEKRDSYQKYVEAPKFDELAYSIVQRMKWGDIKPQEAVLAARRAAKRAYEAKKAGDVRKAIFFKRQEIYQTALAKNLAEARENRRKMDRYVRKFRKQKPIRAIEPGYYELIKRTLEFAGIYTPEQLHLNPTPRDKRDLHQIAVDLTRGSELMANFPAPPQFFELLSIKGPKYIEDVAGYEAVMDFIREVEQAGRNARTLRVGKELQELEEVQEKTAANIRENATEHKREAKKRTDAHSSEWKDLLRRMGLEHARGATLAQVLDGSNTGPLTKLLVYPADHAMAEEANMQRELAVKLNSILAPVRKRLRDKTQRPSSVFPNWNFTFEEAFTALLNMGNEGNRNRLFGTFKDLTGVDPRGDFDKNDPKSVAKADEAADAMMGAFFDEFLTPEDVQIAQQIWDIFDSLQSEVGAAYRRVNGFEPLWVQPRKLNLLMGETSVELKGGYYPICYDRHRKLGADIQSMDQAKNARPIMDKVGVADGHMKARLKEFDHPLTLTTVALFQGLGETVHYITTAEFVGNARKILRPGSPIVTAIEEHYGADVVRYLNRWVEALRDGPNADYDPSDVIGNTFRQGVSLAGVGLNFSSAFMQLTGFTQTLAHLGPTWTAAGLRSFLSKGPIRAYQEAAALSLVMRDRATQQFRDINEIRADIAGANTAREKLVRIAYMPIVLMQMTVDVPTWWGAYQKALSMDFSREDAIQYADRAVKTSQGSGLYGDLAPIERGTAFKKLLTVFYTFFNTALNLAFVSGMNERGLTRFGQLLAVLVVQPILEALVKEAAKDAFGSGDDDDGDPLERYLTAMGKGVVGFNLGLFVGVREFSALMGDYGYQGPSGMRKVADTYRAYKAIESAVENGEISESNLKAFVSAMGVWLGVPIVPVNRFISGYNALVDGDTDNPLVLLTGA